nr:replication initiation protein [Pseudomonas sp. 21LCFQ02]
MAHEKIYKSNALIEASYTLSVAEQRIILACIAQVDRGSPITDEVMYSVPVATIAKAIGSDSKSIYKELLEASRKLRQRSVKIELEPNGGGRKPKTLEASWVQSIVYNEQEGVINLRFNKDMLPFLTELKEQFTRYNLSDVAKMTSIYSIRLFEMLIQYTNIGSREIALVDLRKWLQLNDKYALMADLRRYVIEPAVNQMNEHSPLQVRYELKRSCRKITHLNFIIGHKRVPAAEPGPETPTPDPVEEKPAKRVGVSNYKLSRMAHKGESLADALNRLNVYVKS